MNYYFLICSNPECSFEKKVLIEYGREKYCPECAFELMWKCHRCGEPIRNETATYCSMCRAELKDNPEQTGPS
jgi:hypothetical protein